MSKFPTAKQIKRANEIGIEHATRDKWVDWYNPTLGIAYGLGHEGIDLSSAPTIQAARFGEPNESGVSHNYKDDISEHGCSVAWIIGREDERRYGHWMELEGRNMVTLSGIEIPDRTGSDGEPLILVVGDGVEFD